MSERDQDQSVSEALATELVALLAGMEQERARARAERREWNQEQARRAGDWERTQNWYAEQAAGHHRLLSDFRKTVAHQATEQTALSRRLEHQHAPWRLGLSRDRWKVVLVSAVVGVVASWTWGTAWERWGPPATARAEEAAKLEACLEWWGAATPPQREQIQQQREKIWKQQNKKAGAGAQ